MKKLILLSGISLLIGATSVQQARAQVSTAPVTVAIDLTAPVISITLGADPSYTLGIQGEPPQCCLVMNWNDVTEPLNMLCAYSKK